MSSSNFIGYTRTARASACARVGVGVGVECLDPLCCFGSGRMWGVEVSGGWVQPAEHYSRKGLTREKPKAAA